MGMFCRLETVNTLPNSSEIILQCWKYKQRHISPVLFIELWFPFILRLSTHGCSHLRDTGQWKTSSPPCLCRTLLGIAVSAQVSRHWRRRHFLIRIFAIQSMGIHELLRKIEMAKVPKFFASTSAKTKARMDIFLTLNVLRDTLPLIHSTFGRKSRRITPIRRIKHNYTGFYLSLKSPIQLKHWGETESRDEKLQRRRVFSVNMKHVIVYSDMSPCWINTGEAAYRWKASDTATLHMTTSCGLSLVCVTRQHCIRPAVEGNSIGHEMGKSRCQIGRICIKM
eukprot:284814619_4